MIILKSIIPYENDKTFDSKIAEITSISLEHEEDITKNSIDGNFIVSGDYKSHMISVNKEEFNYKIPFSIELPDNVIEDSITFDINDFTYEIKDNNILSCKIEVVLEFDEESETEEREEQEKIVDATVVDEDIENTKDLTEVIEELNRDNDKEEIKEEKIEDNSTNIIMDNAVNTTNTYVNYHIYIVKENDNLDDIAKNYNISKDIIMEYNNNIELKPGNKILIPEEYE